MYEGLLHWMHPPEMENPKWNYVVLGLAALFDGGSFLVGYRQLRTVSGGQRLWRVIRTSKDPSIFTVVLEDLADLAGLLIAFLGIYCGQWLKNPHLDGMASVLIGLILALMAVVIMHETKGLLLGESADDDMLKAI
jgi:divalent metal cation (Fe/Co/Zn/Cd) transporter